MQTKSLRLNFALNTSRTVLNLLIPLVIFPYVSRVLGPGGTGKVEFANSIVSYFVLFTALGIPTYGIRETARVRDDDIRRSATVWELTLILLCTAAVGYIAYGLMVLRVPALRAQWLLFCIVAPNIALSDFSFEWFYQGIENQTYITVRYIMTKVLQVLSVFLLIKQESHYLRYAAIYVGMNSISALFNIVHLRKYIRRVPRSDIHPARHIKSIVIIFGSIVATSIYMHLDVTMLGFFCGDATVGIYAAANRLVRIVISLVTALSAVVVPRLENCLVNGDEENYRRYLNLSLHYILMISIPCCLGLVALAPDIIAIFAGSQYAVSVLTIRLLSPIVIIVGLAYFTGLQVLYPHRQEWKYTVSVSVAAVANAIFNALMIPRLAQDGAALGTVLAECVGLILQLCFARAYLRETDLFSLNTLRYVAAGAVMYLAVRSVPYSGGNIALHCAMGVAVAVLVYGALLLLLREPLAVGLVRRVAGKNK